MPTVTSINLTIHHAVQLQLTNGNTSGIQLQPGDYVAKPGQGQQPGCFELYGVSGLHVANVYLEFSLNGSITKIV